MANIEYDGTEIAVIGMAGRFPGARDLAEFWRNLRDGVDAVRRLEARELAALGVPAALAATRAVESRLYGLSPTDPATLLVAVGVLLGVALLAGSVPGARATRVNPVQALRYE